MIDFTGKPQYYMAAGPRGVPAEDQRGGLVLNDEVLVAHRSRRDTGSVVTVRVRGFCIFALHGACFSYLPIKEFWSDSTSFWCPIDGEGIDWCRLDADEETRAAMMAAATMC